MSIKTYIAALGVVGALVVAASAPALARAVYVGQNGVGVDTGRYRRDDPDARGDAYERGYNGCRTITIQQDDDSMKIRRCD